MDVSVAAAAATARCRGNNNNDNKYQADPQADERPKARLLGRMHGTGIVAYVLFRVDLRREHDRCDSCGKEAEERDQNRRNQIGLDDRTRGSLPSLLLGVRRGCPRAWLLAACAIWRLPLARLFLPFCCIAPVRLGRTLRAGH